jgi:mono/diheme cytochrome c family protein
MDRYLSVILILCCALLVACTGGKESPRGFSLPEGTPEAGKATFIALQCNACHSTPDVEQLVGASAEKISVRLGGEVGLVKTYADLVTSIINPSHRLARGYPTDIVSIDGKSRMRNYNDVMTVEQLIDLVAYLQPHYPVHVERPSTYRGYYH